MANHSITYEARLDRPLAGSWLRHGVTLQALIDEGGTGRDFYGFGYELQLFRRGAVLGPYGLLGGALGMGTDTARQGAAALWSVGAGLEWRPLHFVGLGFEGRYWLSDRGPRGFWRPGSPRKGWSTVVGLSIVLAGRRPTVAAVAADDRPPAPTSAPAQPPLMILGGSADVVQTALAVLGSPYQWGGTAENGFDCSGLIQYSYGRHGIRLPRMSRDQAEAGAAVPPALASLLPGDILVFASRPGGQVTHVGLYVGEGKFVHSSSTGVRVSRLDPLDPDGKYWIPKWVGARRVLP